jgi:Fic family protein
MAVTRHPFISFEFGSHALPPSAWYALGEAMSKCQHLAGVPLKPQAATELARVYLARGVAATTAIEGNTLSEDEVQRIVDRGSADVSQSRQYLQREVQNVLEAIREIDAALAAGARLPITVERLTYLNQKVLDGIPDKPEVIPGVIRQHDVTAGTYVAPHYPDVPALLDRFVRWLREMRSAVTSDSPPSDRFVNAVLAAIVAHLYIAWIHPFGNGNGRLARLIEVQILSESGVVPLVATNLLSNHYNKTRNAYYLALDAAQHDVTAFVGYALQGFVDELREQIEIVKRENILIHWESYVYETFRKKADTTAKARQREVALSLPEDQEITPEELPDLTPALARKYAVAGARMPARDLNFLVNLGLFEKTGPRTYRARRGIIQAFIPPTAH